MTSKELEDWFDYHQPTEEQIAIMAHLRALATELACTFQAHSVGPDQTVALRKLKDTVMAMNAAVVAPMPAFVRPSAREAQR